MSASQTPDLFKKIGVTNDVIPGSERVYFEQRARNRVLNFLLEKFIDAQKDGLTKAELARRIEKTPDVINRWLGAPTNLTIDTICDLLLGICGEELIPDSRSPASQPKENYSLYDELCGEEIIRANSKRIDVVMR